MCVCVRVCVCVCVRARERVCVCWRGGSGGGERLRLQLVDDTFEEDEPPNFSKVFRVVVAAAPRTHRPPLRSICHPSRHRKLMPGVSCIAGDEHVDDSLFAESAELDTIAAVRVCLSVSSTQYQEPNDSRF